MSWVSSCFLCACLTMFIVVSCCSLIVSVVTETKDDEPKSKLRFHWELVVVPLRASSTLLPSGINHCSDWPTFLLESINLSESDSLKKMAITSIQILQSNNVYSMYVSSFTYKATVMCAVVLLVLQYVHICLGMSVGTHKTYAVCLYKPH